MDDDIISPHGPEAGQPRGEAVSAWRHSGEAVRSVGSSRERLLARHAGPLKGQRDAWQCGFLLIEDFAFDGACSALSAHRRRERIEEEYGRTRNTSLG